MKESTKDTIFYVAVPIVVFGFFGMLLWLITSAESDIPVCIRSSEMYMLEVNNGTDKTLGRDFDRAKELANGRAMYIRRVCDEYKK
jgi:hypothetical protein